MGQERRVGGREVRPKGAIQIRYYYYYRGKEGGKGKGRGGGKGGRCPPNADSWIRPWLVSHYYDNGNLLPLMSAPLTVGGPGSLNLLNLLLLRH